MAKPHSVLWFYFFSCSTFCFPWSGLCYFIQLSSFLWNYLLFVPQPSARGVVFHNTIKWITQCISAFLFPGGVLLCAFDFSFGWTWMIAEPAEQLCRAFRHYPKNSLSFSSACIPPPSFFFPSFHFFFFFYSIHIECHCVLGIVLGTVDRAELIIESWTG